MFMGDIDQNQFQSNNTNNEHRALQRKNVSINEAIPNREAQTKHLLSTYTDTEKSWIVTTANEELSKDTRIMLRLKHMWREQYPKKTIAKQNLKDNAARFKNELKMNVGSEEAQIEMQQCAILNNTNRCTTE